MVLVGDVHVMTRPDVVADRDAFVTDDADALPEHAAVADDDDGVARLVRLCRHPRADARQRSDRAALADRDAALTEDHRGRKRDHAALAESVELVGATVLRPHGAQPNEAAPTCVDHIASESPEHARRIPRYGRRVSIRIGLLYDYPQGDDLFIQSLRLGLDEFGHGDGIDFVERTAQGHPAGSPADVVAGFDALVAEGVDVIVGPSISDNALVTAPRADAHRVPAINYSGGERTRSE